MIANYHTHTYHCHHATGTPREYIEAALAIGLTTLGFSDHVPYREPDGSEDPSRFQWNEIGQYFEELSALREEYADRITIHIGFESEYYPAYFKKNLAAMPIKPEYLILGQHFVRNGAKPHVFFEEGLGKVYADEVCEGMRTGAFTYVAHPDVLLHQPGDPDFRAAMTRICETAVETDTPLEFNLLGFGGNRHYPDEVTFRIAAEMGAKVILGIDAHDPSHFADPTVIERAMERLAACGVTPLETVPLRDPCAALFDK